MVTAKRWMALAIILGVALAAASAYADTAATYRGQVANIKIVECNLIPGSCKGTVTLKMLDGKTITANIQPKTVITRGVNRVTIQELGVGNFIEVRGILAKEGPSVEVDTWDIVFWNG